MLRTSHGILALLTFTICLTGRLSTAAAQVGTGWTEIPRDEIREAPHDRVQQVTDDVRTAGSASLEGAEALQLVSCVFHRVERRYLDEYHRGTRQLQADVTLAEPRDAPSPLSGALRGGWQIVKAAADAGNAVLGDRGGILAALSGRPFRINLIHDADAGELHVYINGLAVWTGRTPATTFFARRGCYGPLQAASARIKLRHVKLFSGGESE